MTWLVFTLALLGWWIYFGFHQVERLSQLGYPDAPELASFQRMLMWEGGTLIALIIGAGCAGIYLLARELRTQGEIRAFFSAFTHDMRTSLSALLLKIEALGIGGTGTNNSGVAQKLASDVERMRLQLDNALLATVSNEGGLNSESLRLIDVISRVAERFSELSVATVGEVKACVLCDARALESMISNLLSNSLAHGKAGGVTVKITPEDEMSINLRFSDDGSGFAGQQKLLGKKFTRHYSGSGAGLGLSIVKDLALRSGGQFHIEITSENCFIAHLSLRRGAYPK